MYDKSTPRHKPTPIFILLIFISLIFIIFNPTRRIQAFRDFIHYVFTPTPDLAMKVIDQSKYLSDNLLSIVRLKEENRYLREQVNRFAYLEKKYGVVTQENDRLKNMLGLKKRFQYDLISARVTSHDSMNYFKSIMIDKGYEDGIRIDLPVITFVDSIEALVGRVASVDSSSSKILLVTDELSSVPVKITKSGETGLVRGQSGPLLMLEYLFLDARIKIGDEIITSGIGEVFPPGLYIGVVQNIKSTERGYFKQAAIKPNVKLNKLTEVFIVKNIP